VSSFLKSTPFETTFDGDKVTCRFKPIKQADSLRIFALRKDDGTFINSDLLPLYSEIVPNYCEEFKGLRSPDGQEIPLADVVTHTYFTVLLSQLGGALAATGRAPDPKALASQPGDT
jgi:hypothetical protein